MADEPKKRGWKKKPEQHHLTAAERQEMPRSDFALPGHGKGPKGAGAGSYPIEDEGHARAALSRVAANGTPAELRQRSELAGAVTIRVTGLDASALNGKLSHLPSAKRVVILKEEATRVTARAFPRVIGGGTLASDVADLAKGWLVEELHTEEGRLDEVFRSITMPDTTREEKA